MSLSLFRAVARPSLVPRALPLPLVAQISPIRLLSTSPLLRAKHDTPTDARIYQTAAPVVDYSKGPSALDKAAQVFFFTEILRG